MGIPDLSIVIPTYNRAHKVSKLISNLEQHFALFQGLQVEIVISDNHSFPEVDISDSPFLSDICNIVRPPFHLETAEENFLFALSNAQGIYSWILGDDDEPCPSGIAQLAKLIKKGDHDFLIFNSLAFDTNLNAWSISRLKIDSITENTNLVEFIRKVGFWSVPSGFSTLVFRTAQFDKNFMGHLHFLDLKIYSHVTTLLHSYHNLNFAAIAFPLVKYSSNAFDNEPPSNEVKSEHWISYAKRSQKYFRYPWTFSFLKQVKILESEGIFSKNDLFVTLDQGHVGNRFFLFDMVLSLLVDQLIYEELHPKEIKMSMSETEFILDYLQGVSDHHDNILDLIAKNYDSKISLKNLLEMRDSFLSITEQLNHRFVLDLSNGKVFQTAFGYYWTPFKIDIGKNFNSHSKALLGLSASTLEELEIMIHQQKEKNLLLLNLENVVDFDSENFNLFLIRLDKLKSKIPLFIRRILQK